MQNVKKIPEHKKVFFFYFTMKKSNLTSLSLFHIFILWYYCCRVPELVLAVPAALHAARPRGRLPLHKLTEEIDPGTRHRTSHSRNNQYCKWFCGNSHLKTKSGVVSKMSNQDPENVLSSVFKPEGSDFQNKQQTRKQWEEWTFFYNEKSEHFF